MSAAAAAGLARGDVVLSVAGNAAKSAKAVDDLIAATEPGKTVRFDIKTLAGRQVLKIKIGDAVAYRQWQAETIELEAREAKRKQDEAAAKAVARAEEAERKAERAKALQELIQKRGPITYSGRVQNNAIGQPEIVLLVTNVSTEPVEAIEFFVAIYDKFGEAVPDAFGNTNKKVFKYQEPLKPNEPTVITMGISWHRTAGKATVMANRFVMANDRIVEPPGPPVIEVRK